MLYKYHKSIGFPKTLQIPKGLFRVQITQHAQIAAKNDHYQKFSRILHGIGGIDLTHTEIIEVETVDKINLTKVVCRLSLLDDFDLSAVIQPTGRGYKILTCWLNRKSDHHSTLRSIYDNP